jgi:hypothetical protein
MTGEWVFRIVLFGLAHWVLAGILLQDLVGRRKVFGRRKAPWAISIIFIPCFGSLTYLAFHPQILTPDHDKDRKDDRRE